MLNKQYEYNKIRQLEYVGFWEEAADGWKLLWAYFPDDSSFLYYQWEACRMVADMFRKKENIKPDFDKFNPGEEDEEWQRTFASAILDYRLKMLDKRRLVCLLGDIIKHGNMAWVKLYFWAERKLDQVLIENKKRQDELQKS